LHRVQMGPDQFAHQGSVKGFGPRGLPVQSQQQHSDTLRPRECILSPRQQLQVQNAGTSVVDMRVLAPC